MDSKDSRALDTVTPSVVKTDMTSPRNGGSHGKRRHKRIGIKKVDGPAVPLPPVKIKSRYRRNFASKSLITPRDIRPPTRKQSDVGNKQPDQQPDDNRDNAPIVDTAPPDLQLALAREDTFTGQSRCSTAFEDKIEFTLQKEKPNLSIKSIKRPSKSRQSSIIQNSARKLNSRQSIKSRNGKKEPNSARSSQKNIGLTVKSLQSDKNSYVKHAKAVYKDRNVIYRKKIKLKGKIKKKKSIKSATSIKLDKITKEDIIGKPKEISEEKTVKDIHVCPECTIEDITDKVPDKIQNDESEKPIVEIKEAFIEKPEEPPTPVDVLPVTSPKSADENFFMCSNDEDNEYAEFMEKRKKEQEMIERAEKQKYLNFSMNLVKSIPKVSKKSKVNKSSDKNPITSLMQNVESFARFSVLRKKFSLKSKNDVSKERKEAVIEQKVLTQVYFNYNLKSKSRLQLRRQRTRPSVVF
ncbi:uncharacterized protein LOC132758006 [Ruditapes philippinarum]|uniref:uncharacterized protein LOC132758006 n=1 Tax=Ruditapes philippinarum TaxID=129788 RepID=UPI00295C05D8|nr:uncharacterized protein LOC132758006 [Ruditapes philippinarum]